MNNVEIRTKIDQLYQEGYFQVKIDREQIAQRYIVVMARMKEVLKVVEDYAQENQILFGFNHNKSAHKVLILNSLNLGFTLEASASKDLYEAYKGSHPVLDAILELGELENERRFIHGNAKGEHCLESYLNDEDILVAPLTITDGRIYFNRLYSMPSQLRHAVSPVHPCRTFAYFDLSAAELTLIAYLAGDQKLTDEILGGQFWPKWYSLLGLTPAEKGDIKVALYSVCYSLSDYSIPPKVSKRFFVDFFREYPATYRYLKGLQAEFKSKGSVSTVFDQVIPIANTGTYKDLFKACNYPIQFGLSSISMYFVLKLSEFFYVNTLNFDSFLLEVTNEAHAKDTITALMSQAMSEIGIEFKYKLQFGKTYYEAQYGEE